MEQASSAPLEATGAPSDHHNNNHVNITNITSMVVERDPSYDVQSHESLRWEKAQLRRKIKLVMLMQQLEFLFYALVVLSYTLDGKNLIFILRTVSEVQFSQPKQIQPDRPLRFFALASMAICFCALTSHLSLISSSASHHPSGILVDFVGQFTCNHPLVLVVFLVALDLCSCLVQLLLVLISFTQSHSISISVNTTNTPTHNSTSLPRPDHEDVDATPTISKTSESDQGLRDLRDSEAGEAGRAMGSRGRSDAMDYEQDMYLFDLPIWQVKALLFCGDPPTTHRRRSTSTASISPTTTSTPRPSSVAEAAHLPTSPSLHNRPPTENLQAPPQNPHPQNPPLSSQNQAFIVSSNLPPRTVVIPIV